MPPPDPPDRPGRVAAERGERLPGPPADDRSGGPVWAGRALFGVGAAAATAASFGDPRAAAAAAGQDWPPFVLVAGLLVIGLVAARDGLFAFAGRALAAVAPSGRALFAGVAALVAVVTALLNLDTAVAFLTPIVVHTARRRGEEGTALLCSCVLLANAGSLLLPGSNLTNLIVLGHLRLSGGAFVARTGLAWVAAVVVTAAVIAWRSRRELRRRVDVPRDGGSPGAADDAGRVAVGTGLAAVVAALVLVIALRSPALPVAGVAAVAGGLRLARRRLDRRAVLEVLGLPVLVGLLGVAVALGTLGRVWSGPADLLAHLGPWATGGFAAATTIVVNNLPATSLLAARVPPHPYALLAGLDIGPNLLASGSLAWVLWAGATRAAGARPPIRRATALGLLAVPPALAAALGALALTAPGR